MKKPYIIAEVGSNWNRPPFSEMALALRNIDDAAASGASAVKFQLFTHQELYGVEGENKYELPRDWIPVLSSYAHRRGIDFMCTAFSSEGLRLVDPYVKMHKIASCEMQDYELIKTALKTDKQILISTGGASLEEIQHLKNEFKSGQIKLLECVVKYPAQTEDYNLQSLSDWAYGISDHTIGNELAIAATGAGAHVFEKHFDCLKDLVDIEESPDTPTSIGTEQLKLYIQQIKNTYQAVNGEKFISVSDAQMQRRWRRRLKVIKSIKGQCDALEYGVNYGAYRSLDDDMRAASPIDKDKFEGKRVRKDMKPQEPLWFDDIN